ncbi:MAG: transcription-repair coupling factor [Gammaproteobacteria bacterium]|nr:transcription-repair coupling factor [Gammaproteobacteria bacterium]
MNQLDDSLLDSAPACSPFDPPLPSPGQPLVWSRLYGSATGLVLSRAAAQHRGPLLIITADTPSAEHLEYELRFYAGEQTPVVLFPDRETLPYDNFSPHQDIISQRLGTLYQLPTLQQGILVIPVSTLMVRLPPRAYLDRYSLMLDVGQRLDLDSLRQRLEASGYRYVSQVMEHGEFCVRGSLIDLFPMGSQQPYRIDLLDEEIDSIRTFDPETQRSLEKISTIRLLPAREFPLHEEAITRFRQNYRQALEGDPQRSTIYRDVSQGLAPAGVEYYLPLFFEQTALLFDYLPANTLIIASDQVTEAADTFWQEIHTRYEQAALLRERPPLKPEQVFITPPQLQQAINGFAHGQIQRLATASGQRPIDFATALPPPLNLTTRSVQPLRVLEDFLDHFDGRVLFAAESAGRRETLLEMLRDINRRPQAFNQWSEFLASRAPLGIIVAALDQGLIIETPAIAVITESQLFGEQVMQRRRRKRRERDTDMMIQSLSELEPGAPVVHEEHGVGRYGGLHILEIDGVSTEFLMLQYAEDAKLYVPVSSLHLISRYAGASPEQAPLHRLGSDQWHKAKRKAAQRAHDVAAELLDIYARREARKGHAFPPPDEQYAVFAAAFPFEETPDQQEAIDAIIKDMNHERPMDRLICGDVGFGKTEVAMRAAFLASHGDRQVAVLVPTTLLAQQHYQNFKDRFADLPIRVESLSRFAHGKRLSQELTDIADGKIDIVIGTHKLLQDNIKFGRLGLVIIDEEHRFGVRQKERFKKLRSEVDVLTLTATPIPRTLNMSLSGLRDLSVIATPPLRRLTVKTFVREWNDALIREAILREIRRGGQVYLLHNEVRSIERTAQQIRDLVPEAAVRFGHGQMREQELEQLMTDFYHQRFNVLVSTTIIESGIDVPNANTIIIERADKLGLAQLYQLRGRVGRSHHQAYAYLITPPPGVMTADAVKRLEAIESITDLGAGFTLAMHDLEIRGAGELLGDEQSGQIQEIGFTLYADLLERAVKALKSGRQPELDAPLAQHAEIDLQVTALIPEDYLPDVHSRLVLYKRIASAASNEALRELQVEMIDRFGLLPEAAKNLFRLTELKLLAEPLGVRKIEASEKEGHLQFDSAPQINADRLIQLIQTRSKVFRFNGRDRLRFTLPQPGFAERADFIAGLLGEITP